MYANKQFYISRDVKLDTQANKNLYRFSGSLLRIYPRLKDLSSRILSVFLSYFLFFFFRESVMDNYPPEFILHHVPLMAVIGLGTPRDLVEQPTSTTSSTSSPVSSKSQSRRSSLSATSTPNSTRQQLSKTLLALLTAKSQVSVWEPGKSASAAFHVVAVDKVC